MCCYGIFFDHGKGWDLFDSGSNHSFLINGAENTVNSNNAGSFLLSKFGGYGDEKQKQFTLLLSNDLFAARILAKTIFKLKNMLLDFLT